MARISFDEFSQGGQINKLTTTTTPTKTDGRFADVGEDIKSAFMGTGRDIIGRASSIKESFQAGKRGEQSPFETGIQTGANVLGGALDIGFRGIQAATTPFLKESEERAIETGFQKGFEATGIPQKIGELSPRTQRNLQAGLDTVGFLTAGTGGIISQPVKRGVSGLFREATQPIRTTIKTAENIIDDYAKKLRTQVDDPNLSPQIREKVANDSLTFKEKMVGLKPDEKKRLEEMGEGKITEYLDATHLRNISDTPIPNSTLPQGVWGPQELGNYYVTQAFNKLNSELSSTGSKIGQIKTKYGPTQMANPQITAIETTFNTQIANLGLGVKNGQIVTLPNKISKATTGDVSAIQDLYNDLLKFKQSPTIENAYDLRANFDSKIKFGQSARDVSNAVDPLSRNVRATIAKEAENVIGKQNASEFKKYSDFMDAYSDLKSYVDRSAGSEFLLRRSLSGLGREERALLQTIKDYTGIDLMNDATAMKIALSRFANENQQNLFKQEISRAGLDVANFISGGPVNLAGKAVQKLVEFGIDEEAVIKAAASGVGGYLILTYADQEGIVLPAGLAVLSAMPRGAREEALTQANKVRPIKLSNDVKDETLARLMQVDTKTTAKANSLGGETVDFVDFDRLDTLKGLAEKKGGLKEIEYVEAKAILDKYQ
jgi:hypothetical protein